MLEFSANGQMLTFARLVLWRSQSEIWRKVSTGSFRAISHSKRLHAGLHQWRLLAFASDPGEGPGQLRVMQPVELWLDPGISALNLDGRCSCRSRYEGADDISVVVEAGTWSSRGGVDLSMVVIMRWRPSGRRTAESKSPLAVERTTFAIEVESGRREVFGPCSPTAWAPQGAVLATIGAKRWCCMTRCQQPQQWGVKPRTALRWSGLDGRAIAFSQQRNGRRWVGSSIASGRN
jgi:hypothetical protein